MLKRLKLSFAVIFCAALSACGGGSGTSAEPEAREVQEAVLMRLKQDTASDFQLYWVNNLGQVSPALETDALSSFLVRVSAKLEGGHIVSFYDDTYGGEHWWLANDSKQLSLVADINPGSADSTFSEFDQPLVYKNKMYIIANIAGRGYELWSSDGSSENTQQVKEINPDGDSIPQSLFIFNDILYFTAYSNGDRGLWRTDGSEAGTELVKQAENFTQNSNMGGIIDDLFFISSGDTILVSDGSSAGSYTITTSASKAVNFTALNGQTYFIAGSRDKGLWTFNRGAKTVTELAEFDQFQLRKLYKFNNKLIMVGRGPGDNGLETWLSDGTLAGTQLLVDGEPGPNDSYPSNFIEYQGSLYFTTRLGVEGSNTFGSGLWKTDGTVAGTVLVKELRRAGSRPEFEGFRVVGDRLIFAVRGVPTSNYTLWISDGSEQGTGQIDQANGQPWFY